MEIITVQNTISYSQCRDLTRFSKEGGNDMKVFKMPIIPIPRLSDKNIDFLLEVGVLVVDESGILTTCEVEANGNEN